MAKETLHPGFYIPNAADVTNPRMAEPDRVDFSTLAHPLWGVVEGGLVTCTGTLAQATAGTVVVNGQLVAMAAGSVNLGSGDTQDRFDLVVCDSGGIVGKVTGTRSVDPVFPDPPLNSTVLAAVFIPAAASNLAANVIDKRKFVNKALLTKITSTEALIRNIDTTANLYLVDGGGKTTWGTDTWMWRSSAETLSIHKHLALEGSLDIDGEITVDGKVQSGGLVTGTNLKQATTAPGTGNPGDFWQNPSTGKVYIRQNNTWQEMATIQSANPPGTIITSLEIPEAMAPLGWLPLDGRTVNETNFPTLFTVQGLASRIIATSPRTMTLPDARKLMLVTDYSVASGTKVTTNVNNKIKLATTNLPQHGHSPQAQPGGAANPTATTSRAPAHVHTVSGGAHGHGVNDVEHRHRGMDLGGGVASGVICAVWGGQNKLDALFNDRNHTYSVEPLEWTMPAYSGLTVRNNESHNHIAEADGDHDHTVTVTGIAAHVHNLTENLVGDGTPFDITPEYLTVYSYVRT